uniref:hypothetical protein n=1 Tax=Flavobacterium sp. TaxID=239 RepID=UPI0040479280
MKFSNIFVLAIAFMLASTTVTFAQSTKEKVQIAKEYVFANASKFAEKVRTHNNVYKK